MENERTILQEGAEEAEISISCLFSADSCEKQSGSLSVFIREIRG
jgi:hypothetical protein